ncbi:MAG: CDP-glucose 4,6-dehydratase [Sedimentitalea sp.]
MSFWAGKRVLLTGHTGFQGSWLALWLSTLGADVYGVALAPDTDPSLFDQLGLAVRINNCIGDICDRNLVDSAIGEVDPDVVFHLAAHPMARGSQDDTLGIWNTNVMGSAHILEALRKRKRRCAVVMVTADKVYQNRQWPHPYRESDPLGGHDPYSASKAATEMLIASYRASFFKDHPVRIASARAGNVIGGGEWASDRLVPDMMRALAAKTPIKLRDPNAIHPWQHVLEPLSGYLKLARKLFEGKVGESYNFGPETGDAKPVKALVEMALAHWPGAWEDHSKPGAPHKEDMLSLGIESARADLGYAPRWDLQEAVKRTVIWYRDVAEGGDPLGVTLAQIQGFEDT